MISTLLKMFMGTAAAGTPSYSYWHVYVDGAGLSAQKKCQLTNFELKGVSPGVTPQWLNLMSEDIKKLTITEQPVGWVGDWHENPGPQWIIPLKGRWFVETSDGRRVVMGPGEISLGEDQNTKPDARGHRGHLSGTVGRHPVTLMIVSLKSSPTVDQACHQR